MNRVHHCSNLYFIPEQAQLASWLVNNSCAEKVFFCNSGAESNEAAIKLSRKYAHTKLNIDHPVIITAVNSFHGRTLTAITATGQAKYQKDFGPLTPGFEYVEYNNVEELKAKVKVYLYLMIFLSDKCLHWMFRNCLIRKFKHAAMVMVLQRL